MVWKVALGLVVALMLPVAAYAAGNLTAPTDAPAPRQDIVIDHSPSPTNANDDPAAMTKAEREARVRRRDRLDDKRDRRDDRDDVKVVTPQPTPVNNDDGDDGADDGGDGGGDDDGDDDDDDGDD